ncbi:hypothetical protein JOF53_004099 [Crossiella equi]|uniref:Uncharacterized protein n=1 Tax=Crossiella equi TaxID=130796 RepID=A0ABS5AFW0_9PSEU|nr:hypothetical protein [Crossiella equi]MBP2475227.1 hypothetical protein [Crossiella equi]
MQPEAEEGALARERAVALLLALRAHDLVTTRDVLAEASTEGRGGLVELVHALVRGAVAMVHEVGWDLAGTLSVKLEARPDGQAGAPEVELARELVLTAVQREADGDPAGAAEFAGRVVDARPDAVLVWGLVTAAQLIEQLLGVCRRRGVPVPGWLSMVDNCG